MDAQFDLNLLRVFDALLQEGSVTGAAERLSLSIPAASRALARLRRAMGDPVLVRAGRGMTPTPFALAAAPRVRALLDQAGALTSADRDFTPAELQRTFTLRVNDGVAATLVSTLGERTAAAAPGVVLRFVAEGAESPQELRDGAVDLDVGVAGEMPPDLHSEVLYRDRVVGIVRADSPLGRRGWPTLAQLCKYPHISASRRGRARGPLDDLLDTAGLSRHVAVVVPTYAVAALVVASSSYVALAPARLAEEFGATLGIRAFDLAPELPDVAISMVWHARVDADPAQRWLRDAVRAAVSANQRGGTG